METVPRTGSVIGGRYRTVKVAWRCAAGPVLQAVDGVLDRNVLLFMLAPDVAGDERARETLLAAAARAAQIIDPNLAQIYDCSSDPPYLVSEMPAGGRLADRLPGRPMPLGEAARIVVGVGRALRLLHEHGAAHGAVSPGWVGTDEEGRPKLLGTGIAEVAAVAAAVRGLPPDPPLQPAGYPEPRTDPLAGDTEALATLAFHLLAGKLPGHGATLARTKVPPPVAEAIERGIHGETDLPALIAAFLPHAVPAGPVEREPGFLRTEGRWLGGVVLAIAVAAGIVLGALALVRGTTAARHPPASSLPTASPSALHIAAVRDFDPLGTGSKHSQQAALAIDGKQFTAWFTVGYATADFGHTKTGVGLVFDLGSPQRVSGIHVLSPFAGWQAEWRVADQPAARPEGYRTVGTFTAATDVSVPLSPAASARYWLLWITRLTDTGSGPFPFQAAVAEVQFLPAGG